MTKSSRLTHALLAASLCALAGLSQAAPAKQVDALRMQYERERADCMTGKTQQPRDACLREASSAYAAARKGQLVSQGESAALLTANALKRCEIQRGEDRTLCERRVREGDVQGSAESGGQSKSLTIRSTDIPKAPGN